MGPRGHVSNKRVPRWLRHGLPINSRDLEQTILGMADKSAYFTDMREENERKQKRKEDVPSRNVFPPTYYSFHIAQSALIRSNVSKSILIQSPQSCYLFRTEL